MKKRILILCFLITIIIYGCTLPTNKEKDPLLVENEAYLQSSETLSVTKNDYYYAFKYTNFDTGIIFCGKDGVDVISYAPLLHELANNGYAVFILQSNENITQSVSAILSSYKYITSWYIGGHSLGGIKACEYLEKNHNKFEGLFLLSAYSMVDLSNTKLKVLSVYGSNDQIFDYNKYKENQKYLGENLTKRVIEGGNHSYFGNYGVEDGDGAATVSKEYQRSITIKLINELISAPIPQTPVETPEPELIKLETPVVEIDDTGLATWEPIENVSYYQYQIDSRLERTTTSLSIQLEDGQTFKIKAMGDQITYTESDYSTPIKYVMPILETIYYEESTETFANPDRGFYHPQYIYTNSYVVGDIKPEFLYRNSLIHL